MLKNWENIIIGKVHIAMFVVAGTGSKKHFNRYAHGFVLNDSTKQCDYYFSDGTVLHTYENNLYYLPKGSYYEVKEINKGGCYAINFDADILDKPFCINFRNSEKLLKIFSDAEKAWRTKSAFYHNFIKKSLYEIIYMLEKEELRNYLPNKKENIILPALEIINSNFTKNISIIELSKMCNISDTYFRKLFSDKFDVNPKEYIISLRINYAKDLLKSGQFTVSEVSKLCGYSEECHFSRIFKKITGENPNEYK